MKKPSKNNEPVALTEETALAFFARHLDQNQWSYNRFDENSLQSAFNGDDALWNFFMFAQDKGDGLFLLGVHSFIPIKTPAERRAACVELLNRINFQLNVGCFDLNPEGGEIRFRTSSIVAGSDITDGLVEHLIRSNLAIVDERLKPILAVICGNATPEQALASKPTAPEQRFDLN